VSKFSLWIIFLVKIDGTARFSMKFWFWGYFPIVFPPHGSGNPAFKKYGEISPKTRKNGEKRPKMALLVKMDGVKRFGMKFWI